ncbi:MAG: diacylglycerol kinase [Candidatus Omnitrophica bacterium]|nr:diacylglycerol kinase [Candidatus Omnitrophota bacterium]
MNIKRPRNSLVGSFNAAIEGFLHVVRTQRNMRIHFIFAVLVLLVGIYFNFSRLEIVILSLTIGFVLVTEMFNTVIEFLLDRLIEKHDEKVKIIKDISAGTVLVASIVALVVAYFLFLKHSIFTQFGNGILKLRQSEWHITFLALILVIATVILSKAILRKGTPLRGGMPSGHAAVSFSMFVIVVFVSSDALVSLLAFILAVLVSQSRIRKGLHTFWEVLAGALLGTTITILIYQLLSQLGGV